MLEQLIGTNIWRMVRDIDNITEIRLRLSCPLLVCTAGGQRIRPKQNGVPYIVSRIDIDGVLSRASNMSLYSVGDEICKGYISTGHFRIGVAGEGVMCDGRLANVKNISYLVVRVPRQIKSVADGIYDDIVRKCGCEYSVQNTLVISPTGAGKTTMLRELARKASYTHNVVVIDERFEICALSNCSTALDIGECEVICGVPKTIAYENCVRAMNPDIIVTDELFGQADIGAVQDIVRSGVKVFASLHGNCIESVKRVPAFAGLFDCFDFAVVLGKNPVGTIVEKVQL